MKKGLKLFLRLFLVVFVLLFVLPFTSCNKQEEVEVGPTVEALEGLIGNLPEVITLKDEENVNRLKTAYDKMSDTEKNEIDNYDILVKAFNKITDLKAIDSLEVTFTSVNTLKSGESYTPSIDSSNLTYKGSTPSVTFDIVGSTNSAKATINDGVVTPGGIGTFELSAHIYYSDYAIELIRNQVVTVNGYKCVVNVTIPEGNASRLESVRISSDYGILEFDKDLNKFVGYLPAGENVSVSCALDGFVGLNKTVNIEKNDNNVIDFEFVNLSYGPQTKIGLNASGSWSYDSLNQVVKVTRGDAEDTSMYAAANGLSTLNVMISADIKMVVGEQHTSPDEGSGILFSSSGTARASILVKPGQCRICLCDGSVQNLASYAGSGVLLGVSKDSVTVYNGAAINSSNGRVNLPAKVFTGVSGTGDYTTTCNLCVIRLNTDVYVLVNGTLYASFNIPSLDGVYGSLGFTNFNHDSAEFSNLQVCTDLDSIIAPLGADLVSVNAECSSSDASVLLIGDIAGNVIVGKTVVAKVTPSASTKHILTKITGGEYTAVLNEDSSINFTITATGGPINIAVKTVSGTTYARSWKITPTASDEIDFEGSNLSASEIYMKDKEGYVALFDEEDGIFTGWGEKNVKYTAYVSNPSFAEKTISKVLDGHIVDTVTFDAYSFGPTTHFTGFQSKWTYNAETNTEELVRGSTDDGSYQMVADVFAATRLAISSRITMRMGDYHSSPDEGSGILFLTASDYNKFGILVKPGQGLICFSQYVGYMTQDVAGISSSASNCAKIDIDSNDFVLSNGAEFNSKGRILIPDLETTKGKSSYEITIEFTIIRDNSNIYVLINGVLYVSINASDLNNMSGGVALFNVNQDYAAYQNVTLTTDIDSMLCAIGVHNFDEGRIIKEPTIDEEGIKECTCTRCSTTEQFTIKKLTVPQEDCTINFSYESAYVTKGNERIALYDLGTVNPSDVKVTLYNVDTEAKKVFTFENETYDLAYKTGTYVITYEYNGNAWSDTLTITKDNHNVVGGLSTSYLGGSVTYNKMDSSSYTLKSFNNNAVDKTYGTNWALATYRNSVKMTGDTFVMQNEVVAKDIYVEGKFDTLTQTFASEIGSTAAGLLVAHGRDNLVGNNTYSYKLIIGIRGTSVIATETGTGWKSGNSMVLYNLDGTGIVSDWSNVKLGVLRVGTTYYIYVNDTYVAKHSYKTIGDASGVGIAMCGQSNVTIKEFNYSTRTDVINALKVQDEAKQIDIYLIAGQSNASGNTQVIATTMNSLNNKYVYGFNNIYYAGNSGANYKNDLNVGLVRIGQGESTKMMGPEVGLAEKLSTYYNEETGKVAGIIRYAVGGTCLLDVITGLNASDGNWASPSYLAKYGKNSTTLSGGLYTKFLAEFDETMELYKDLGYTPVLKGFYWMQGENDRSSASSYTEAFKMFVSDMRADLTTHSGQDCSNLPFIVGEISETFSAYTTDDINTNKAFNAVLDNLVNEIDNCYVIKNASYAQNSSSGVVGSDRYHWNYKDHLLIGSHIGECILNEILGVETSSNWYITK